MEVKVKSQRSQNGSIRETFKNIAWLDRDHPNFEKWKRGRDLYIERGKYLKSIVEKYLVCKDLTILDLGSGEGGTSIVFSKFNQVISYDLNLIRLERQKDNSENYYRINGNALNLSFKKNSFDLIILQDVIEHLPDVNILISEINRVLRPEGIVYISTPNKYSVFNFISDPHWGLPFVSILRRESIRKFFLKIFRKKEINRPDIAQLFSLKDIQKYFGNYFAINLETKHSVEKLLNGDKGIIWSNFHLRLINLLKTLKLKKMILLLANDKIGIINKYFNPTFYLVMKKIK